MIAIVDYGLGNVAAFANIYKRLNVAAAPARTAEELRDATKIILPGVGAFDQAVERLTRSGMREPLEEMVRSGTVPVLGVCVGMQMLAANSAEGRLPGLDWIPGSVKKFDVSQLHDIKALPHMGWNDVEPAGGSKLFDGLEKDARFYFLHSYYFDCADPSYVLAETEYGIRFSSAVCRGNLYGVQFHPEKSHRFGVRLLQNFASL
jgi:glutamine amidotransferase